MNRAAPVLAVAVALLLGACGPSASSRLSKYLIPAPTLESTTWGLRPASSARTLNPFGVPPSQAPLPADAIAPAEATATRQWVRGSGALGGGALPEGLFSVIDRVAHFRSDAAATSLADGLVAAYGAGSSRPVTGVPGATVLSGAFSAATPTGQLSANEELAVMARGAYVFTVLVVGGGSRPTPADAQSLATLQAAAIPPSLS